MDLAEVEFSDIKFFELSLKLGSSFELVYLEPKIRLGPSSTETRAQEYKRIG